MNDAASLTRQLAGLLDEAGIISDPARTAPMLRDHRALYRGHALAVVAPADTAAVARVVAFCNQHRIGVVPQGGNTSYCGGATPDASGSQILLSLARLNRVRALDAANYTMVAEAGCILASLQTGGGGRRTLPAAQPRVGRQLHAGGKPSTNAGGINVIRYGMARDLVLGLEVVLADGRVLDALTRLARTTPATTSSRCSSAPRARSGSSPRPASSSFRIRARATHSSAVRDPRRRRRPARRLRAAAATA